VFTADPGWVPLVVALATVATRLYLRGDQMAQYEGYPDDVVEVRDALWSQRDLIADHLMRHSADHTCGIAAQLRLVGWDWQAFVVAATFDCRELVDG